MLRPILVIAVAAAVAVAPAASARRAAAPAVTAVAFVFTGHGWGHGVGMSQWGARGFAERGAGYAEILAHYYPGTTLGPAPVRTVRVLLAEGRKALTVASEAPFRVRDAEGGVHELEAGPHRVDASLRIDAGEPLPGPLVFLPRGKPLALGKPYRGSIRVAAARGRLSAVNVVGLEAYLYGVVPDEMPPDWPAEALKAQAVAARSYALSHRQRGGEFDLYGDVRSQVYGGVRAEEPTTNAAVAATKGQVVLYQGAIANTLFFSSSGGRTAPAEAGFRAAKPIPYLVSVPDPYDRSPHRNWGPVVVSGGQAAKALKVPGLADLVPRRGPEGRVREVMATGRLGARTLTGPDVRFALGLRSTWFDLGVLSLSRPAQPVVYGGSATLAGSVRGLAEQPGLEARSAGGAWQPVAVAVADGRFSLVVRPETTTQYRLRAGQASVVLRLPVAPAVRLDATFAGTVRPAVEGTEVELQRQEGRAWVAAASAPVDATGAFSASGELPPGTYRARYAPGRGLVAGLSPPVQAG